ncbi:SDR family oxidoreductase [Nocardioides sp. P86]|uniref:SDR family NAD(P)-dependent oxidoreductase n=1 Tax=Nocardioides sp. P86 TaxID=2939569 RepID=UPI00203D2FB7|nr:SDR family oxidoreductase [Nocardioides sp. P86]MCM3516684.1 SDR family oxidoreductase [Nocardioides sp. P86]
MELSGARALVVGASGVLGAGIARALVERGATVSVAGRDAGRLAPVAQDCGTEPLVLDLVDTDACREVVGAAADAMGGLDLLVVATGVAGFGPATEADPAVVEELFAVNTLGPMALVRAAAGRFEDGGTVAVLSAILAELPTNQMAEYSATKAALSTWLTVLRRENRRAFTVLDVRPPHLDTGLAERSLAGEPPKLPAPLPGQVVVDTVVEALASGATEVVWDAGAKELVAR